MKKQYLLLLITTIFLAPSASVFASIENKKEEEKLIEELTGKKVLVVATPVAVERPMSRKLLDAGFFAFTKKEYISALKYYNTIIVKYPASKELRLAYLEAGYFTMIVL